MLRSFRFAIGGAGRFFALAAALLAGAGAWAQGGPLLADAPDFIPNPSGRVPLAAVIEFQSEEPLQAQLSIVMEGAVIESQAFGPEAAQGGIYALPVLGMRPGRIHEIELKLDAADGRRASYKFQHRTPPLPGNPLAFPPLDVQLAQPERMEPGITFLSVRRRALGRPHWMTEGQRKFSTDWGMLVAIDARGEVIWYYQSESRTAGIDRLRNGNLLMHRADSSTLIIDMLGREVQQFYAEKRPYPPPDNPNAIPVKGLQTLHHQPHQMPNGNFLAFSANASLLKNYYTKDTDPNAPRKDLMVMADTVIQLTPQGEVVWSWNTLDYLDPYRIGYDTTNSYWWVRGFDQHMDWSHGNGLSYDAADDSILVSLRNQLAILKIDNKTKEIKWILGRHKGWPERLKGKLLTPVGDLLWPGYQHNPRMTHAGTVILFDNRAWSGAMPYEEPLPVHENFSRGVEYEVDEEAMTVRQIWSSGDEQGDDPCFSNAMSEAWRLPQTDNRLVIFAFCLPLIEGITHDEMDHSKRSVSDMPYGGRIVEYAGDETVFRAEIKDASDLIQWEVYGGFRSPGLYHEHLAAASSH